MMKAAILAMAALAGSASAQECATMWRRCDGPEVGDKIPCCSAAMQCVQKNDHYAQCRPIGFAIPEDWLGGILFSGEGSPAAPVGVSAAPVATSAPVPVVSPVATPAVVPAPVFAGQCAATYKRCGSGCGTEGCGGQCCDPADHCVKKSHFFAACRPKDGALPAGWLGTVIAPRATAAPVSVVPTPAPVVVPTPVPAAVVASPTDVAVRPPVSTIPTPASAMTAASAGSGQCALTYKQCGGGCGSKGCGGNCCDPADHCVKKSNFYASCRPKDRAIPNGWLGTTIAPIV